MSRFFVPEVVQTSNMDCGPAALKSLLEGFGIPVNYGRLREACQTGVDGTSIDTIEAVANQLGLRAEQIMLPADHVLLDAARALPAIAVVVLPNGVTHFVIVWRKFGRFVELMDPAVGRRWVTAERFIANLYVHKQHVAAEDWREYAGSDDFLSPLGSRLMALGINDDRFVGAASQDASWRSLAALDASVRMAASLIHSGAIHRGAECARVLDEFLRAPESIPEHYWSVQPAGEGLMLRGAVLVRALGPSEAAPDLSPELNAVLQQPSARPGAELLRLLRADGVFTPAVITL
ncbi:MAG TPA: cysteine peptidase family C39 domain-containing protein, partial [Bryobacteraceae bacterium]|nr:cysteine peptidase family C39 domain-containing protein [Bryobacteraceae bacterium]